MDEKTEVLEIEIGKDEMNLAEFPIAILSKRHSPGVKTIEFSDEIIGPGGSLIKREWIVTGSDKYGLPLAQDDDVFLALICIAKEDKFSSRQIFFSRYQLCSIMKWEDRGWSYKRIEEAFDRFKTTGIKAINSFWDNEKKAYVTRHFGIIDDYELYDKSRRGQESFRYSYVRLNEALYESIKAGYIKTLNTKTYFSLNSAVAKRLYRYLDKKKYDGKKKFTINLFALAEVHIGLQKTKYASHIKEKMDPAHKELIGIGFLKSAEYQKTSDQTSEKVVYTFGKKAELTETAGKEPEFPDQGERQDDLDGDLLEKLLNLGITRKVAEQILREYPDEAVRTQIEALPHRKAGEPPAVLIASIQGDWTLPVSYQEHLNRRTQEAQNKDREEQETREKTERRQRIEKYLAALTREEMAELTREAREQARKEGGSLFRDREIPQYMINGYLHVLVEKKLEVGQNSRTAEEAYL